MIFLIPIMVILVIGLLMAASLPQQTPWPDADADDVLLWAHAQLALSV